LRTGIEPNYKRITELVDNSLMLVTALNFKKSDNYKSAEIAQTAHKKNGTTLKEESGSFRVCDSNFDAWVKPEIWLEVLNEFRHKLLKHGRFFTKIIYYWKIIRK
jgi:fumarate hydratase class II